MKSPDERYGYYAYFTLSSDRKNIGRVRSKNAPLPCYYLYMPEYRRLFIPGGTYFFTVATYKRQPIFSVEDDFNLDYGE